MPTEASKNTPLTIAVTIVTSILVLLLAYSYSAIHTEVGSPSKTENEQASSDEKAPSAKEASTGEQATPDTEAPGYGGDSSGEGTSPDEPVSSDEGDSSDDEAAAPGYGE